MTDSSLDGSDLDALLAQADWVRRLARSLLRDENDALDLSQDVLHDAVRRPVALRGHRLRAWLAAIARHKATRLWERSSARRTVERDAATPEAIDAEEATDRMQSHVELAQEIQMLGAEDCTVLVAHYVDGTPQHELAAQMNLSQTAVRARVARARRRLRERLDATDRGRDGWRRTLTALGGWPALPLGSDADAPQTPAVTLTSGSLPALTMTLKLALPAAAVALAALIAVRFASPAAEPELAPARSLVRPVTEAKIASTPDEALNAVAPPAERREARAPSSVRSDDGDAGAAGLWIVDPLGQPIAEARAAWVGFAGGLSPMEVTGQGRLRRTTGADGLLFVAAPGFVGRAIEIESGQRPDAADKAVEAQSIVLAVEARIDGRVTVDGVAPDQGFTMLQRSYASDLGLPSRHSEFEEQLASMLGLRERGPVSVDRTGRFQLPMDWDWKTIRLRLPASLLVRTDRYLAAPDRRHEIILSLDDRKPVVDLTRLPAVRGRLVWSDDQSPVTGWLEYLRNNERGFMLDGMREEWLTDDGRFEIPSLARPEEASLGAQYDSTSGEHAHSIRLTLSGGAPSFMHTIELDGVSLPIDLGDITVERFPKIEVIVTGTRDGSPEPQPVDAVVRGAEGRLRTGPDGRASVALAPGSTLEVLAMGYRYQRIEITQDAVDQRRPIRVQLDRAPILNVQTPPSPGAGGPSLLRVVFARTPFGTASLDEEERGTAYDFGLLKLLSGGALATGGWSHSEPGAPGTVELELQASGSTQIGDLVPGAGVTLELLDCLEQVLIRRDVLVQNQDQTIDLGSPPGCTVTIHVRWQDGSPVRAGTIRVERASGAGINLPFTDGKGVIGPLAPDRYTITVSANGAATQVLEPLLLEGSEGAAERRTLHVDVIKK